MSGVYIVLLIIVFVIANNKAKKKKAAQDAKKRVDTARAQDIRQKKRREEVNSNPIIVARNSRMQETESGTDTATDIEKRRLAKRVENTQKSRIHQNINSSVEDSTKMDAANQMAIIHELIVCGYPVNIPGDRDFIKEGEDFLDSLAGNSLFY